MISVSLPDVSLGEEGEGGDWMGPVIVPAT